MKKFGPLVLLSISSISCVMLFLDALYLFNQSISLWGLWILMIITGVGGVGSYFYLNDKKYENHGVLLLPLIPIILVSISSFLLVEFFALSSDIKMKEFPIIIFTILFVILIVVLFISQDDFELDKYIKIFTNVIIMIGIINIISIFLHFIDIKHVNNITVLWVLTIFTLSVGFWGLKNIY